MYKKIGITILMVIVLLISFNVPVFADPPGASTMKNVGNPTNMSSLTTAGNKVVGVMYAVRNSSGCRNFNDNRNKIHDIKSGR